MYHSNKARGHDPVVTVDALTFSYGIRQVLHGISFALGRGEVVGLLGPNGAGKSTTIKVLTGILPPKGGTVRVAGYSMPTEAVEAKKRIGYVPEEAALFESLTGQEFLELMGRLQEVPEEILQSRIGRFLEQFELAKVRNRRLDGYSKGMRQKVLLSAALLHNPDVVMLDEPLSGLDVNAGFMVLEPRVALEGQRHRPEADRHLALETVLVDDLGELGPRHAGGDPLDIGQDGPGLVDRHRDVEGIFELQTCLPGPGLSRRPD